jgi:hypothetical protein
MWPVNLIDDTVDLGTASVAAQVQPRWGVAFKVAKQGIAMAAIRLIRPRISRYAVPAS